MGDAGPDPLEWYRTAVGAVDMADWSALQRRVEAAAHLGRTAWGSDDRFAWELAQLATWRLHRRGHGRPTDPGDVCVLDTLFRASDLAAPRVDALMHSDVRVFCARLEESVLAAARIEPDPIARMCRATLREWQFLAHNMVAEALDFTRTIALASLPLPHRHARRMYHNLFDEAGRGDWERSHFKLFADFARAVGVPVPGFDLPDDDDTVVLDWTVPEVIAEINEHNRALWSPSPGPALGALFVVEHLVPSDFRPLIVALRALGLPPEKLAYFEAHVEEDPGHAEDWMEVVASYASTPEEQQAVFSAAIRSATWYARAWRALCDALDRWSATGEHPTLPARMIAEQPVTTGAATDSGSPARTQGPE